MKFFPLSKCALILGASLAFTASSYADSLLLYSSAAETSNDSGLATVNIPKNSAWAGPLPGSQWVSYVQSGDPGVAGFTAPPNGTTVNFSDSFFIAGIPMDGIVNVLADDTASVTLNGVLLMPQAATAGNTYSHCSDFAIGCLAITEGNVDLSGTLLPGLNTLSFAVTQDAGQSYGLDYAGTINYTATPEPTTLALMGLPLAILGFLRRKRQTA